MKPTEIMVALAVMQKDVKEIKADLKEHMARTAAVEGRTSALEKFQWMVLGAGALVSIAATLVGIYATFRP